MAVFQNCDTSLDRGKFTCMNCPLKKDSLFNELSYEELEVLDKNRYVVSYKAGETICKEGTKPLGLLCLNKGKVKIIKTGVNGTEQIVALKKPVDFIGFRALMGGNAYLTSSVALEDATVCIIDKNDFYKIVGGNKQLAFNIIRLFVHELNESEKRMVNLTQKHVRARLADALLLIDEIYGTYPGNGALNVSLKRADLAALANMTTANAIRVLSAFAKEKLVEINRRSIKIKDLNALRNISVRGR